MASEVNLENSKTTTQSEEAPIPLQRQIPRIKAGDQDSTIESKSQALEIEEEGLLLVELIVLRISSKRKDIILTRKWKELRK
jgi:hypothetical protein